MFEFVAKLWSSLFGAKRAGRKKGKRRARKRRKGGDGRPAAAAAPQRREMTPERRKLLDEAMAVQRAKADIFKDLEDEEKQKLLRPGREDPPAPGPGRGGPLTARARPRPEDADVAAAVRSGDRRALAQAITLIESTRRDHRALAEALLGDLLPHTGRSVRLGISGVPGAGKSTFIEALGLHVIAGGHRVAVLAVDPSSPISGGSILGDKTRMVALAQHADAFIRPSPTAGTLGGVARRTREAVLACEAAGFDVVIVETVGVGQSEVAVADLVDVFALLLAPGAGDELQGIKRGIVELADLVVVNKADGDMAAAAEQVRRDYASALGLLRPSSPHWSPRVLKCSALEGKGIAEAWSAVEAYRAAPGMAGEIAGRRRRQARAWMWSEVNETLMTRLRADPRVNRLVAAQEDAVARGEVTPAEAARAILGAFLEERGRTGGAR